MHLGIHVVQPLSANAAASLRASAQAAEALGYRSLWVGDRLIEGRGEANDSRPLDALASLAYVAAATERIRLGTSVLAGAWYPPVLLARALATVDQLSRGRLAIGMGSSPSAAESLAAGIAGEDADQRVDDLLTALTACWADGSGAVQGPSPIQQPRPPILLVGRTDAELDRVGRLADGWHADAGASSLDELEQGWARVHAAAAAHGRDPGELDLVVRIAVDPKVEQTATADQVAALRAIGASEVVLSVDHHVGLDAALATYAAVAEAIELRAIA